jgi:uncharacterized protein YbaA (DUF1428 family)
VSYVDGFLLPLPIKNIAIYRKMARLGKKVWLEHGALDYREYVGEDLAAKFGMPFTNLLGLKKGETAVFAFITYKSRKHRDQVNKKVMADKRLQKPPKVMPFDMAKMCYGGFEGLVE